MDAANLWRAKEAGLIDSWKPLTLRARTIMRSTERVKPGEVTTYEGLGDPRWKGRLCLRSGTSEYNVSFVADRIAKDGRAATERMLRRWMANDPTSSARTPTCWTRSRTATATSASPTPTTSGASSRRTRTSR